VANIVAKRAEMQPLWDDSVPERLSAAVDAYSLPDKPEWSDLDELSSGTIFEGIDVFGDDSMFEGGEYFAPANVYVKLQYGGRRDGTEMTDVYPARVRYNIDRNTKNIVVKSIKVDTSSFFE
jgi:hypothetical protein